jgi:ribose-phosphate pyrophosphokinase
MVSKYELEVGKIPESLISDKKLTYMSAAARQLARLHKIILHQYGDNIAFLTGSGNPRLANDVASLLGQKLSYGIRRFGATADGKGEQEVLAEIPIKTDNKKIFIFQSTGQAVNTEFIEVLAMLDALKRMNKVDVTVVMPYMGYGRAEKKDSPGRSITAKLVADLFKTAGANRVMTCDMHSDAAVGFYDIPVDHLYSSHVLIPYVKQLIKKKGLKYKGAACDDGAYKRNLAWAKRINGEEQLVTFKKERDKKTGETRIVSCQGEIKGNDLFFADDLYGSGKTLEDCAVYAKRNGAKSARGIVAHGLFLGDKRKGLSAVQALDKSALDEIIVTDSIDIPDEIRRHPKVKVISLAPLLAEAIYRNIVGESLSDLVQ